MNVPVASMLGVFLTGGVFATVAAAIVVGLFARRKQNAETRNTDAMTNKVPLDAAKVAAETDKVAAEAAETLSRAALTLIGPYRDQVASFQLQVTELRADNAALRQSYDDLRMDLGILTLRNTELETRLQLALEELGVLRRWERAALVEQTKISVKLGIEAPVPTHVGERTRSADYHPRGEAT